MRAVWRGSRLTPRQQVALEGSLEGRRGLALLQVVVELANHFEHVEGQVVELQRHDGKERDHHKGTHTRRMVFVFYRWAVWRNRLQHKPTLSCCLRPPQRPVGCRPRNSQELIGKSRGDKQPRVLMHTIQQHRHMCANCRACIGASIILCSLAVHPRTHENQNRTETTQHKQEHAIQALPDFYPLPNATHAQSAIQVSSSVPDMLLATCR